MAIDDTRRALRRRHIGSSDAAAVVGLDPFGRTRADVWLEKTGRLQATRARRSMPQVLGTFLEAGILSWAEAELDTVFARDVSRVHPNDVMAANLDGLALASVPPMLVEAKSAGLMVKPAFFDDFGEPGTDQVPDHVRIQVHHQFGVLGGQPDLPPIEVAIVPALLIYRGFVMYRLSRNDELVDAIQYEEERFWRDYVVADRMPEDVLPSLDSLRDRVRAAGKSVALNGDLVAQWQTAKDLVKQAGELVDEKAAALLTALGDAEVGTCPTGTLTYRETTRKGYAVAESTFRALRFKKADTGKKKGPTP